MKNSLPRFLLLCLVFVASFAKINGHGYLIEPPGRSSAWRKGFDTPRNIDDNEVTCGRVPVEGCGICGDPLNKTPRPNEDGGLYGRGKVVATYKVGQVIRTVSKITANHMGWFEFSICPVETSRGYRKADESCLKPLIVLGGNPVSVENPETKWELLRSAGTGEFVVDIQLPPGLTCKRCLLRWLWNCGNDWKCDASGRCGLGLGPKQEKFYSCADIAITSNGEPLPTQEPRPTQEPTTRVVTNEPTRKPWKPWTQQPVTTTPTQWITTKKTTKPTKSTRWSQWTTRSTTARTNIFTPCANELPGLLVADPDDCCGFIVCLWTGTPYGREQKMRCPRGTAWKVSGFCDHWYNVVCGQRRGNCDPNAPDYQIP